MNEWKSKASRVWQAWLGLVMCGVLFGAPTLTTVQDTLYKADGTPFTGMVIISWKSFDAADTSNIATNVVQLRIVNGLLRTRLVPTTNAASPTAYSVRYVSEGKVQFNETWAVPPSSTPVRVRDIRITSILPGGTVAANTQVEIANVNGLQEELDLRPIRGQNYVPSRAVIISSDGSLEAAIGDPGECVRVDGSAGPCGAASGGLTVAASTFVDDETPSGAVDGFNSGFTLSGTPNPSTSLLLYRNGLLMKRNFDYTISGANISFLAGSIPQAGDLLLASYRVAGTGNTLPHVLCSSAGIATSLTTATSLGVCPIPSGVLRAGDRIEVNFDYTHEGTGTGFQYSMLWGSTSVMSRSAAASDGVATGRASLSVVSAGAQWSTLDWGNTLALAAGAGSSAESGLTGITINLRGQMLATTTETVTLRNFTVIRYPAP
jgi:hypothetical protein